MANKKKPADEAVTTENENAETVTAPVETPEAPASDAAEVAPEAPSVPEGAVIAVDTAGVATVEQPFTRVENPEANPGVYTPTPQMKEAREMGLATTLPINIGVHVGAEARVTTTYKPVAGQHTGYTVEDF